MAYTNATFYLDYESGSDAARTALTSVAVANNGSGLVRCTKAAHGLVTGAVVDLTLNYAGAWKITVIDSSNFDLVGSTYSTATACTVTPRGGSSMADAWKTIPSGATAARHAAGDTVRVKGSPDPTSLGQTATWTDGPLKVLSSIVSSTNATPIVLTLSGPNYTLLAPAVGDTVIVNGHTTNTNANGVWAISAVNGSTTVTLQDAQGNNSVGNGVGAGGTIRKATYMAVKLTTAVTKNIAVCGNQGVKANWTASSNITTSVTQSDFKEGGECQQIDVALAFTTGLAAYFPTGTLDLSGYQQVSFWFKQVGGTLAGAGALSVKLCTDTAGATPVHTVNLPAIAALGQWMPFVFDLGTNMNSAIASVALYVNTDNATQTFRIDNVFACKASSSADSLNLTSLIGKNTGSEAWFGIQSINGTRVMLDASTGTLPAGSPQRGYSGTTETVTTYKRETIKTGMQVSGATFGALAQSGTAGNLISYSGGWNRTDMTTQTGETWWDGQNGLGNGIGDGASNRSYISIDKVNFTRYNVGYVTASSSSYHAIGSMMACACTSNPINMGGAYATATTLSAVQNGSSVITGPLSVVTTVARADGCTVGNGITVGAGATVTTITQANNNGNNGVGSGVGSSIGTIALTSGNAGNGLFPALNSLCNSVTSNANSQYGISSSTNAKIMGGSTTGNVAGFQITAGVLTLRNFTANEGSPFTVLGNSNNNPMILSERNGGVADAHLITADGGSIVSATDQRNTASGISWKFRPTSVNRNSLYPLTLSIAKVACAANVAVNLTVYTRRDNTNIVGTLRVRGLQLAGIPSDVTVSCTPAINTWVQSSALTVTPTEDGVIEVLFEVYDGVGISNNFWIDDFAVA